MTLGVPAVPVASLGAASPQQGSPGGITPRGFPHLPVQCLGMLWAPHHAPGGGCATKTSPEAGNLLADKIRSDPTRAKATPRGDGGVCGHRCGVRVVLLSPSGAKSVFLVQFQIRALESQKRQQEIVLRRKTQEVRGGHLWGGPSQAVAQRHRLTWAVLAGSGTPKGWEGVYGCREPGGGRLQAAEEPNCPSPGAAEPRKRAVRGRDRAARCLQGCANGFGAPKAEGVGERLGVGTPI